MKQKYKEFVTIVLIYNARHYTKKSVDNIYMEKFGRYRLIDNQISSIDKIFREYEIIISVSSPASDLNYHIKSKHGDKNIRIVENLNRDSNSCEDIRLCLHNSHNSKIMLVDGRIVLDSKLLSRLDFSESFAIISDQKNNSLEIGANVSSGDVCFFCYGARHAWAEIVFLSGYNTLLDLERIVSKEEYKNRFLFEAINVLIDKHKIKAKRKKTAITKIKNLKIHKR